VGTGAPAVSKGAVATGGAAMEEEMLLAAGSLADVIECADVAGVVVFVPGKLWTLLVCARGAAAAAGNFFLALEPEGGISISSEGMLANF
jgi:hypothetical protein